MNAVILKPPRGSPAVHGGSQLDLFASLQASTSAVVIPFEPRFEWDDEAIEVVREELLKRSLRVLTDGRATKESRQEVMEWMLSNDTHPFSFTVCCLELGYSPEELRSSVLYAIKRLDKTQAT